MKKELKEQLHKVLDRPRPKPLMYIGKRDGKKVYVRKQSLSYFQLLKKYPPQHHYIQIPKTPKHILARKHHLVKREHEHICGYIMAGCGISIMVFLVIFYTVCLFKAYP